MSERDYTTEVAGDRSKEPVWCGETVETIAGATGEKEEDVRIWLTLAWKAGSWSRIGATLRRYSRADVTRTRPLPGPTRLRTGSGPKGPMAAAVSLTGSP